MFPQKERVPREKIKEVLFEGDKNQTELFLFVKKENDLKQNRFAIIVSKKIAKTAVKRHCLKRLYKNIIKNYFKDINQKNKIDSVFVLNKKAAEANKDDIMSVLKKINL